jgi:hypothetical protein
MLALGVNYLHDPLPFLYDIFLASLIIVVGGTIDQTLLANVISVCCLGIMPIDVLIYMMLIVVTYIAD